MKDAFRVIHKHILAIEDQLASTELQLRSVMQPKFEGFAPRVYVPVSPKPAVFFSLDEAIAKHIEGATTESEPWRLLLKYHKLTEEQAWVRYESFKQRTQESPQQNQNPRDASSTAPVEPAQVFDGSEIKHEGTQ